MTPTLPGLLAGDLERSCAGGGPDRIRLGTGAAGIERTEVFLAACAFARHRHDTYGVGITTAGVQRFWYRGAERICLPGQVHILYPDEVHDGGAAVPGGFGYRILYIAPALLREALGGAPLPFACDPVQDGTPQAQVIAALLADLDEPIDELGRASIAVQLADALAGLCGAPAGRRPPIAARAIERVREHLAAHAREPAAAAVLERIAGMSRFAIARHFRRAYGTSPDRYRTMRRVALARAAIESGQPLAQAAADAGFADQSHMTRHFKRTYGLTPGRWAALTAQGGRLAPRAGG